MADILIRGMEKMPGNCRECMFAGFGGMRNELNVCMFSGESQSLISHERTSKCPLVPLPKGHGRLIDADALFEKMYHLSDNEGAHKDSRVDDALILRDSACYLIDDAPTIVPAEGGTDECSKN